MKTNKSYSKRIKVTSRGKLLVRISGQNHFNAKAPRSKQRSKKRSRTLLLKGRVTRRFLPRI